MTAPEDAETVGLQQLKSGAFAMCQHHLHFTLRKYNHGTYTIPLGTRNMG